MRWQAVLVVLVVGSFATAGGNAGKQAQQQLQGEWKIVKAEAGGKSAPEEKISETKVFIAKNKLTFQRGERKEDVVFTLDPSKQPHHIDISPPGKEKKVEGIYKLEGDVLTISFTRGGGARPKDFTSPEGTKISVLHLKRVKK